MFIFQPLSDVDIAPLVSSFHITPSSRTDINDSTAASLLGKRLTNKSK